jgi:hypothetical protein
VRVLGALEKEQRMIGSVVVLALVAVPVALSVITWRWLSGREQGPP